MSIQWITRPTHLHQLERRRVRSDQPQAQNNERSDAVGKLIKERKKSIIVVASHCLECFEKEP